MSIYKPKGKPYYLYDFVIEGRRFHGSTGTTDHEQAKAIEAAERYAVKQHQHFNIKPEMILDIAAGRFWEESGQYDSASKTTEYQSENLLRIIGKDTILSAIDDSAVAMFIAKRRGEKSTRSKKPTKKEPNPPVLSVSASTVNREWPLLRRIMFRARDIYKVSVAEVEWKKHKLKERPPVDNPFSEGDETRLLAEAIDYLRPPIKFSLLTGVRLSNCMKLDWSQIDMQARTVIFQTKGGGQLRLPIVDELLLLLANLDPKNSGPVFTRDGEEIKSWRTAWEGARRRAGVPSKRWHDLRHTAGSRMIARGVPLSVVQEVLDHQNITTTRRYIHHEEGAKRAALEALAGNQSRPIPDQTI